MATRKASKKGEDAVSRPSDALDRDDLRTLYRDMLLQRRFEEAAGRAYGMGKIYGFCHLYIGQEAVSTGVARAMRSGDILVSAYRIHAQALALGISPDEVMGELFGKATGSVQGLGGSMHLFDREKGFWGGWGLVGQQVPMAVGVAFAQRYQKTGNVVLAFFGDGAMQQGAIHEAFNMASIWSCPIVFVVENNGYGMGTAIERVSAIDPLHRFGDAYKMANASFDGMDVLASYDAFSTAIESARQTSRPYFLEARCSRFRGHSMSDPGTYRTREQLEEEKNRDPIPRLAAELVARGWMETEEVAAIDREVKDEVKAVVQRAEEAPWPPSSLIHQYVYASTSGALQEEADHG